MLVLVACGGDAVSPLPTYTPLSPTVTLTPAPTQVLLTATLVAKAGLET
jgi:hypothetical protein